MRSAIGDAPVDRMECDPTAVGSLMSFVLSLGTEHQEPSGEPFFEFWSANPKMNGTLSPVNKNWAWKISTFDSLRKRRSRNTQTIDYFPTRDVLLIKLYLCCAHRVSKDEPTVYAYQTNSTNVC